MFPTDFSSLERRRLLTICAVLFCALTLPYAWAWLLSPGDGVYSGLLYNPDDQNVHLSWARQAHDGAFFLRDLFTTEGLQNGERPLFTNVLLWSIGIVARVTNLPLILVYHAFRVVFALLAIWWFAALCAHLSTDKRVRFAAVALAAFGGGAGFLAPLFPTRIFIDRADTKGLPMMPEAFTFASAFVFPLFITSVALLVFVYLQTLRARRTGQLKFAFGAAIAAFLLTNIHTYDAIPLNVVMLLWALSSTRLRRKNTTNAQATNAQATNVQATNVQAAHAQMLRVRTLAPLMVVLATIPMLIYQRFVLGNSEEFRVKAFSPKPAPPIFDLFLSLSPLLILAIISAYFVFRQIQNARETPETARATSPDARMMILWAFVALALVYTPTNLISFARKMIEGVHLPLCFLAALGIVGLLDACKTPRLVNRVLVGGFVALMSFSSLTFVGWCLNNARDNNASRAQYLMPPLYLPQEAHDAMQFLHDLPYSRDRAVLCSPLWGNFIPPQTGWAVYTGHFDETLHFTRKNGAAFAFFRRKMGAAQSLNWLRQNRIGWVLIGPNERAIGARELRFPVAWSGGQTTIYRVP